MYIQNYFKDGRPKKSRNYFKSIEQLMNLIVEMNNGYNFSKYDVLENFSKRDLILDDSSILNFWTALQRFGCYQSINK